MAVMRAICSLTAASRKHLKSFTLKLVGTTSSRMLSADGRNSYCTSAFGFGDFFDLGGGLPVVGSSSEPSGSSVSTTAVLPGDAVEPRVGDVEPIELAGEVLVRGSDWPALRLRRTAACLRSACTSASAAMLRNLKPAMPRLPEISSVTFGTVAFSSSSRAQAGALHVRVVAAAQTAVAGEHQQRGGLRFPAALRAADG